MINESWVRIPSGPLVVPGRASDHNCSCAPKTNQGFSLGMETLNGREFFLSKSDDISVYGATRVTSTQLGSLDSTNSFPFYDINWFFSHVDLSLPAQTILFFVFI